MAATDEPITTDQEAEALPPPETKPESSPGEGRNGRWLSFLSFWRRGQEWLEINGYHVEDIHVDEPVLIQEGATLVGNIFASKIIVAGLLSGSAIAEEIVVEPRGQIWGDVFAMSLNVEPGGKVQGWVSTVEEAEYQALQKNGQLSEDGNALPPLDLPDEINGEAAPLNRSDAQIEALHYLQTETAVALAARAELENDFNKRLNEVAGEANTEISSLREQLSDLRGELSNQKKQLDEAQETLRQRKEQVERQTKELTMAHELVNEQKVELSDLRQSYNSLQQQHEQLQQEKSAVDQYLEETIKKAETLSDRVHSLETAHKASLQHSAEQDDSLMRWQELAEVQEKRADELEQELEKIQYQVEESTNTINLLREQKRQIEAELEAALNELHEIRTGSTARLINEKAMAEAQARIDRLEEDLANAEHEHSEQILWYKANLETNRSELEKAREELNQHTKQISKLEKTVEAQTIAAQKWQTAVSQKEAEIAELKEKWAQKQALFTAEKKNLQETLRETRLQIEANEAEIAGYLEATKKQGQHLAEVQARLIEYKLKAQKANKQLAQAKALIEKQNQFIKQVKTVTGERIQTLQAQLKEQQIRK